MLHLSLALCSLFPLNREINSYRSQSFFNEASLHTSESSHRRLEGDVCRRCLALPNFTCTSRHVLLILAVPVSFHAVLPHLTRRLDMSHLTTIVALQLHPFSPSSSDSPRLICHATFRTPRVAFCFFNKTGRKFIEVEILLFKRNNEVAEPFSDTVEDEGEFDFLVEGDADCCKL